MKLQMIHKPQLKLVNFHGVITVSPVMIQFFETVKRVARTEASILLRGETGTGKEMIAKSLHREGRRSNQPFEAINCATLSAELLASELFGHVKGAFTGAIRDKKGLFELADGGTIFLDEVAEMPVEIQARFLRVLQDRIFTPVGSTTQVKVDIRLISATNKSLREMVEKRLFREDLMYRIRVVPLFLPPLVDREGDIEALLWHFIEEQNKLRNRIVESIERRAFEALCEYSWPGNIRELRNNVEYAFAVGEGHTLKISELTPEVQGIGPHRGQRSNQLTERELERDRILEALKLTNGRKGEAADRLGMSRSTLWRKLREHRII